MILRDLGYLSEESLAEAVAYQITEKIYGAFAWLEGEFEFVERDQPAPADVAVAMSTANVIMEGVRRITDQEFIRRALGPGEQVVSLGSNPLLRFQSIFLKPQEGFVLSRIDGVLTIDEVCAISPVAEPDVMRCLYGLKCTGILDIRVRGETPAMVEEDENIASFFTDYAGVEQYLGARPVDRSSGVASTPEERQEQTEILDFASRLGELDHYQVLAVETTADAAGIRKAYYRLAKRFHPDRHHKTHLANLQDRLERIFVRLNEAYEALKDPKLRADYDRHRSTGGPVSREAASQQEAARAADPAADSARREGLAEASYREGRQLLERGEVFSAIRAFQVAVRNCPDRADYRSYLGRSLGRNPKWRKEAEEHLLKAVELEPSEAEHYAQIGLLYEAAGLQTRAERFFDEALKWDGQNPTALAARGRRGQDRKGGPKVSDTLRSLFGERDK